MGLLAPWFLAGLGLAALPVYLHLLKRNRPESKQFSSLMFFEKSAQAELRRRRLDYLALLAARLAVLGLIIAAFAQPFVRSAALPGAAAGPRLVVIDTSASMGFEGRMARARIEARRLMTPTARLAAFDSRLRLTGGADPGAIEAGPAANSFGELARALRAYQEEIGQPVEVHLISDLQRSAMPPGFAGLRLNEGIRLTLHPVTERAEPNWAVESVRAPGRVRNGREARISATIAGFHTPAARKTAVLRINGKTAARKSVDVPADSRAAVEFEGAELPYGFSECSLTLEPEDGLRADDAYLFAIERSDPQQVAFMGNAAAAAYFGNALEAVSGGAFALTGGLGWKQAAVLVAAGAMPPEAEVADAVRRGMGLFIILSAGDRGRQRVPVTGQAILGSLYAGRESEGYYSVERADPSSPMIERAAMWAGVRFYQAVQVSPGQARVVARLSGGAPLLLEQALGDGLVVVMASALDGLANDFPVQPAFVAFVEQAVRRLSRWEESAANVAAGERLPLGAQVASRSYEVLDPSGRRALSFEESVKGTPVEAGQTGFWRVMRGAGRNRMFAANVDRRESDLEPMPAESAELWAAGGAAARRAGGGGGTPPLKPLALWMLAAAVAAALIEAVFAAHYVSKEAA